MLFVAGIDVERAAERGLRLVVMLSFVFPAHFLHADVLARLTALLAPDAARAAPHVLAALTFLGKYRPLSEYTAATRPLLTSSHIVPPPALMSHTMSRTRGSKPKGYI